MPLITPSTYVALIATAVAAACSSSTGVKTLVPGAIELAPRDTSIPQAATLTLNVTVLDTAGNPISLRPVFTWTDSGLVTVSPQGVVRSLGPIGTVTITATLGILADQITVSVFDSSLAGHVRLGGRPYGAAVSPGGVAYITQLDVAQLARADLPARSFASAVAVGNTPTEVAFNSTGTKAYVTNQFSDNVGVVDVTSNTETDVIPVKGDPFEVIVAPGDSILFVTTNVDSVYGIRLATKEVVVAFPVANTANGLALRDTLLYVSTWQGGTVVEFNLRTRTVSRTFTVGGVPQKLALSPDGTQLYIANQAGYVQFWNLTTGVQIGANLMLPGGGGYGIARNPANGRLYVSTAYYGGGNIHIINPTARTLVKTIAAGGSTRHVVFTTSGSVGFVPNEAGWVDFLK